jgi:proteasome assembly chaperone (PAC2) family protein
MDKPYFRLLSSPKLEAPVFVGGLPGFGAVGEITSRLLIESSPAELFAELYTPWFPDFVTVGKDGICIVPHYEFYAATKKKPQLIILTGAAQSPSEDIKAYYELCDTILNFAEKQRCKFLVILDGLPTPSPTSEVYVAATSSKLASEVSEKGATVYSDGRILGTTGLLLGFAKNRGLKGICLLGAATNLRADREAALSVYTLLKKVLEIKNADANL